MKSKEHPASAAGTKSYMPPVAGTDLQARYAEIANDPARRNLKETIAIPARTGKAFKVLQGEVLRVCCVAGPPVADFNLFKPTDPLEQVMAPRTSGPHRCRA